MKKNNHGITLIKFVVFILVMLLIGVIAYEIVIVDVFGILDYQSESPISIADNLNDTSAGTSRTQADNQENIETITPIIEENSYQSGEKTSSIYHYYYQQLDETSKIIYKGLEDNIENMQSGNYKIDFGTKFNDLLNSENGEEKLNQAFQSAWNAFTYDYVDIFYIDVTKLILTTRTTTIATFSTHKVDLSSGNYSDYLSSEISSTANLQNKKDYITKIRKQIVSQLSGYSEYEQIKYLHDWMVDNLEYDKTYKKDDIHNVYGALMNKEAVCEGYARTFKYVLDGLGIESVLVSGNATNSTGETESHAWNYVKLDGKWYAIDVTWDDPIITNGGKLTNEYRYQYFLKGADEFLVNHKEDGYLSKNSIKFTFPDLEREDYEVE